MSNDWIRFVLTAELLSDAHFGSGSGGGEVDALIARDRQGRPVIWASHIEGVLRDAARRLRSEDAAGDFFGRRGGQAQRAIFTSLYLDAEKSPESRIWRSSARESFINRAPKEETLRAVEHVPKGTCFRGHVELPTNQGSFLERLIQEVDRLGSGRASGAGRVRLSLTRSKPPPRTAGHATGRLLLLLQNRDPLCISATATPSNLIPSLAFVPGRALLGSLASWLLAEKQIAAAEFLVSERISVSDVLPLPPKSLEGMKLEDLEVFPAPLSLQSVKPDSERNSRERAGSKQEASECPWWSQSKAKARRLDSLALSKEDRAVKLKRPEDDLFVYGLASNTSFATFRPARRVRLRNGRPRPNQAEPDLFAIEQIVEETFFIAELRGPIEAMEAIAKGLAPVLEGTRWLRLGRGGAPVEVKRLVWSGAPTPVATKKAMRLTLTSDLLVRDPWLRWRTSLDDGVLRELGVEDVQIAKKQGSPDQPNEVQESVMVHGFNGTSRLWRMPAAAIRRGSVFEVTGTGLAKLAERAARGEWLGERTHEGFGRFRLDEHLPGVTEGGESTSELANISDAEEEVIAATTQDWFNDHRDLAKQDSGDLRPPSSSQWFDLLSELERELEEEPKAGKKGAIAQRLDPEPAGKKSWRHKDAQAILKKLENIGDRAERARHARFFVRWLRAEVRKERA